MFCVKTRVEALSLKSRMMITDSSIHFLKGKISDDRWDRLLPVIHKSSTSMKMHDIAINNKQPIGTDKGVDK